MGEWRKNISLPWLLAAIAMVLVIWGNSLVPGSGSSSLSLAVLDAIHGFLGSLGLPYEWVTHFLVRKTAHFTEYAILGVLVTQALDARHVLSRKTFILVAAILIFVPSMDETIQLFVSERSGQLTDVLLDCAGGSFGFLCRSLWVKSQMRRAEGCAGA